MRFGALLILGDWIVAIADITADNGAACTYAHVGAPERRPVLLERGTPDERLPGAGVAFRDRQATRRVRAASPPSSVIGVTITASASWFSSWSSCARLRERSARLDVTEEPGSPASATMSERSVPGRSRRGGRRTGGRSELRQLAVGCPLGRSAGSEYVVSARQDRGGRGCGRQSLRLRSASMCRGFAGSEFVLADPRPDVRSGA